MDDIGHGLENFRALLKYRSENDAEGFWVKQKDWLK
jgi:hypothetical protein